MTDEWGHLLVPQFFLLLYDMIQLGTARQQARCGPACEKPQTLSSSTTTTTSNCTLAPPSLFHSSDLQCLKRTADVLCIAGGARRGLRSGRLHIPSHAQRYPD
jgi:hypothetical protein